MRGILELRGESGVDCERSLGPTTRQRTQLGMNVARTRIGTRRVGPPQLRRGQRAAQRSQICLALGARLRRDTRLLRGDTSDELLRIGDCFAQALTSMVRQSV
jgi:hypothetical protein